MKKKQISKSFQRKCKVMLVGALAFQMVITNPLSTLAAGNALTLEERVTQAESTIVLDSLWEVENPADGKLKVNEDGSITITTERGDITNSMKNVLYYKLPYAVDSVFTVKVSGNMTSDFQAGQLMITSGKNLENGVGVMNRHHSYLGGNYGSNELMGVMTRGGNPNEYYEASEVTGNEFYLRLQKQNGWITGFYAKEYSDDPNDWNQIIDPTKGNIEKVDKNNAYTTDLNEMYVAIAASSGGTDHAAEVTFSDLRVNGQPIAFTANPGALNSVTLSGEKKMKVNGTQSLALTGVDYEGNEITEFDSVTYASSDEEVIIVDENGVVTGLKNGTATVTAKAAVNGVTKTAALEIQVGEIVAEETWSLKSPDQNTQMTVNLMTGGSLRYSANQDGVENIGDSPLGMVTSLGDFSKGLIVKQVSEVKEINESYKMLSGKKEEYTDHCNEQTITFGLKNDASVEMDLVFRVYDDGTAYRYVIRSEDGEKEIKITDETSGLQLPEGADIYWMDYSSPNFSYQGRYKPVTKTEELPVGATPCFPFLYGKDGVWTTFSEADLNGTFCGSMFTVKENGMLDVAFSKTQGTTPVVTTTPFKSPWRAAITGTAEDIVKNTMVENLSTPADYETYDFESWVEPGISSWSWVAAWGGGVSDQSKKETHLNWIDLGAKMGWKYYILDEGWNKGGRGNANEMHDWWPEVRDYAKEKGVKLWVWVHKSDIDTAEERERHFKEWSEEGIVGIKPDFFDAEDQTCMKLYDELYKDAAKYKLMVLSHGANKPTGEIRTWPNAYGREAVSGQEEGGLDPEQFTIIPFARAAVGPAEITEELRSKDYSKTTMGFQVALTALIEDGIHSLGSEPKVYYNNPEGMSYYKDYPEKWIQTELASAEIGQYVNMARKAPNGNWYISGVSQDPRKMDIPMQYLDKDTTYTVLLYKENGRQDIVMDIFTGITCESMIPVEVLKGGGYAMRAIPENEVDSVDKIIANPTKVTVEAGRFAEPIEITLSPEEVEFKEVIWNSADEDIATVDQNGVVRGVAAGKTTVTVASAFDKNVKAEVQVVVKSPRYTLDESTWMILNPTDNVIIEDTNTVTITTENGVLGGRNWKNMFAMDVPEGDEDFVITAKISGGLNADYQGGFVTIFDKENPDTPSLAAGRRHHGYLMGGHPQSFGVMSTQGGTSEFYCADEHYNEEVWIKVEKQGNVFISSYSYDGQNWTEITDKGNARQVINDRLAASKQLCVGFYAGAGGTSSAFDIQISDFTYNGEQVPIAIDNAANVDKSDLEALIEYANRQKENVEYELLVPIVKEHFEAVLEEAIRVNADVTAVQEEVDAAYDNLLDKVHLLSFIAGDKTNLELRYGVLKDLDLSLYTDESAEAMANALVAAKKVLDDKNALAGDVKKALDDLNAAEAGLEFKENVDKTKLASKIETAQGYVAEEEASENDTFTTASFDNLKIALQAAQNVYKNGKATQQEVNMAYKMLHEAIMGLRRTPDKSALEDLMGETEKIDFACYTEESVKAVKAAYEVAAAVAEDGNASQKEVDAAAESLRAAIDKLQVKADKVVSSNAGDKTAAGKAPVKTGDAADMAIPAIAALVAILAALTAWKKR